MKEEFLELLESSKLTDSIEILKMERIPDQENSSYRSPGILIDSYLVYDVDLYPHYQVPFVNQENIPIHQELRGVRRYNIYKRTSGGRNL
jgi:hypothetical protein